MAKNNRYMFGEELIRKGMGIKSSAEKGLQAFGRKLATGYSSKTTSVSSSIPGIGEYKPLTPKKKKKFESTLKGNSFGKGWGG